MYAGGLVLAPIAGAPTAGGDPRTLPPRLMSSRVLCPQRLHPAHAEIRLRLMRYFLYRSWSAQSPLAMLSEQTPPGRGCAWIAAIAPVAAASGTGHTCGVPAAAADQFVSTWLISTPRIPRTRQVIALRSLARRSLNRALRHYRTRASFDPS